MQNDSEFNLQDTEFKRLGDPLLSKEDEYGSKEDKYDSKEEKYDSKQTKTRLSKQLRHNGYEEKKAEDKIIPKLALFKTGMADATRRYDIINKRVREEFDVFIDELKHANDGNRLYTSIADYFKSELPDDPNEIPNGWEVLTRETICKLYSLGELWGTPEIQRKKVNWRHNVLFISQLFEFGFAFSNGGLTLKDDYEKIIGNNAFFGTVIGLLFFQAIVSTYVNWRGINRKAGSQGTIAPVIRIGDKVLIGTTEHVYDEKIHKKLINAKFVIDPKFRPYQKISAMEYVKRKEYNPLAVDFAIHGLDLWYTSQKEYYEWPVLPKITAALNVPSFIWTNLYGALLNSYIFLFLADYIENPIGKILFGTPFVLCSVYAGNYYYKAFTTANVKAAVSKFWTSEDPLTQTGMISFWQRVEVETQWLLNSIARALSIGLSGFSVLQLVIKFVTNFIETNETTLSYIDEVLFIISVFSTVMAFLNTAFSRKKGAEKYLEPFNIAGFSSLDTFIVPSEKLLTWGGESTSQKLSRSEIIHDVVPWIIFYGMTLALPAWMLCSGATTFEYWHILVAVTVWVVKSLLTALAEIPHKSHEKATEAIKKIIDSEEKKPAYDSNGNELLTLDETSTFNKILNILEQLSRILARAGTFGGFLKMYGLPHFGNWFGTEIPFLTPDAVFISVILLTPAINEFSLYADATKKLVNQDINDIRELAGTPVEKIKGCGFSHFLARQLVAFMPYVFVKKEKPIQGITNVTWSQWFSGCWSYSKPVKTSERDKTNTEEKGCWSCFGRLFSGRNEQPKRKHSSSFSGAESFQENINSHSETVFV